MILIGNRLGMILRERIFQEKITYDDFIKSGVPKKQLQAGYFFNSYWPLALI